MDDFNADPVYHGDPVSGWTLFFSALGLAMFLEGLPYFVAPGSVRRYMAQIQKLGNGPLRAMGLFLMAAGLLVTWLSLR